MVIMAAFTLGSCTDDDQDTAYYLAGAWQGQINDGNETYDVHMYFNQDNWTDTYGTGWESDNGWYSSSQAPSTGALSTATSTSFTTTARGCTWCSPTLPWIATTTT